MIPSSLTPRELPFDRTKNYFRGVKRQFPHRETGQRIKPPKMSTIVLLTKSKYFCQNVKGETWVKGVLSPLHAMYQHVGR